MFSIVFIGNNDEINKRFPLYEKALGAEKSSCIALSAVIQEDYIKLFENIKGENIIFVISSQASKNEHLILFLIKNAKRLFFDFTEPLSLSLIDRYRKYKSEAGIKIGVNISPFLALETEITSCTHTSQHIQIISISTNSDLTGTIFKYLIYITKALHSENVKCKFHLISDAENNTTIIVADAFDLQGKYIHLTIGRNLTPKHEVTCYGAQQISKKNIDEQKLFEQPKLLKTQLTDLANGIESGNLNTAITVIKLFEKLKTVAEKLGFSIIPL